MRKMAAIITFIGLMIIVVLSTHALREVYVVGFMLGWIACMIFGVIIGVW